LEREAEEEEVEELLATADESTDELESEIEHGTRGARDNRRVHSPDSAAVDVRELFADVKVSHTAGGGMRIEASAQAATTLAALFEGMAGMLRQTGGQES
jgi:hypothetical protein